MRSGGDIMQSVLSGGVGAGINRMVAEGLVTTGFLAMEGMETFVTSDSFHSVVGGENHDNICRYWYAGKLLAGRSLVERGISVCRWFGENAVTNFLERGDLLGLVSDAMTHREELRIEGLSLTELEREFVDVTVGERRGTEEDTRNLILTRVRDLRQDREFAQGVYEIVRREYPIDYARLFPEDFNGSPEEVIPRIIRDESWLSVELERAMNIWGDGVPDTGAFSHLVYGFAERIDFSSIGSMVGLIIVAVVIKFYPPAALALAIVMLTNGISGLAGSGYGYITARTVGKGELYAEMAGGALADTTMGLLGLVAARAALRSRAPARGVVNNSAVEIGRIDATLVELSGMRP